MTTHGISHGSTIRRRQIAYRLLDRIDALSFVPSLGWLRALRVVLVLTAVTCFVIGWQFYTLLALAAWTPVEVAIVGRSVVEVLRRDRE